jgi:hypothetical protein
MWEKGKRKWESRRGGWQELLVWFYTTGGWGRRCKQTDVPPGGVNISWYRHLESREVIYLHVLNAPPPPTHTCTVQCVHILYSTCSGRRNSESLRVPPMIHPPHLPYNWRGFSSLYSFSPVGCVSPPCLHSRAGLLQPGLHLAWIKATVQHLQEWNWQRKAKVIQQHKWIGSYQHDARLTLQMWRRETVVG